MSPRSRHRGSVVRSSSWRPVRCVWYVQIVLPVAAFSATTSFGLWTVYMTPSTTSGVTSCFSSERDWKTHFSLRSFAFAGLIASAGYVDGS